MEFQDLIRRAMTIRQQYAALEKATYGRAWANEEIALGFVGDAGDLAKPILAHNGVRHIPDTREKLAHELADCLWSIIVLSQMCGVDLESAFMQTMGELEGHISQRLHSVTDP